MKAILAAFLCAALVLGGCSQFTATVDTVCADVAKLPPLALVALDAQDPHSALGVLWADGKAACVNGAPTVGVSPTWRAEVWGMVKALAPTVIPLLAGLL